MASNQSLALMTPKRLEALFLTLSGHELTVKAVYSRCGAWGWGRGVRVASCLGAAWLHQLWLWDLDGIITLMDQLFLGPLPKTLTHPSNRGWTPRLLGLHTVSKTKREF